MRFAKYLGKTFLMFAASGGGTAFGAATVTIAAIVVGQKVLGLKASAELDEKEKEVGLPEELMEQARKGEVMRFRIDDETGEERIYVPAKKESE